MVFANPWAEIQAKLHPIEAIRIKMNPVERYKSENNPFYNPFSKKL